MRQLHASYNDIHDWQGDGYLDRLLPFVGHSMAAGWNLLPKDRSYYRYGRPQRFPGDLIDRATAERRAEPGDRLLYVVWSYSTDVAYFDPATGESWVSDNHWGQTTGRHLWCCRSALPAIRSNDPSAIDGIGPGCRVEWEHEAQIGRAIETHPLAKAVRVDFGDGGYPSDPGAIRVVPRKHLTLI